jgi:hypothetical protein
MPAGNTQHVTVGSSQFTQTIRFFKSGEPQAAAGRNGLASYENPRAPGSFAVLSPFGFVFSMRRHVRFSSSWGEWATGHR